MMPAVNQDVDEKEPEKEPAAPRAPLGFELHAQHRVVVDVRVDPPTGFPGSEVVRLAQRLHRLVDPALVEQRGRLGRQGL